MNTVSLRLVEGPHLLHVTRDRTRVMGVTIQSLLPFDKVEGRKHPRQWSITTGALLRIDPKHLGKLLGMTSEDVQTLRQQAQEAQ